MKKLILFVTLSLSLLIFFNSLTFAKEPFKPDLEKPIDYKLKYLELKVENAKLRAELSNQLEMNNLLQVYISGIYKNRENRSTSSFQNELKEYRQFLVKEELKNKDKK